MTTQELIIGHFEGSLGAAESAELNRLLATSPDVKSAFDRQQRIENSLAEDAESVAAPSALRDATLAAALGTAVQTIGGGLTAFFTAKVAATVGAVLVGGIVIGTVVFDGDDPAETTPQNDPAPVEQVETIEAVEQPETVADDEVGPLDSEVGRTEAPDALPPTKPSDVAPIAVGEDDPGQDADQSGFVADDSPPEFTEGNNGTPVIPKGEPRIDGDD